MSVVAQPAKITVKHPSKAWRKSLVADAQEAVRRDPAYFADMLEALSRAQTKSSFRVVR